MTFPEAPGCGKTDPGQLGTGASEEQFFFFFFQRNSSDGDAHFRSTHSIHCVVFLLAIMFKLRTAPYQADTPAIPFKQELGSPP